MTERNYQHVTSFPIASSDGIGLNYSFGDIRRGKHRDNPTASESGILIVSQYCLRTDEACQHEAKTRGT